MKKVFKDRFLGFPRNDRFFTLIFSLLFLVFLVSCQNFLEGAELKKQLDEQIDYANAQECILIVKSDEKFGSFLSAGEKPCKVGYTTSLQFTLNKSDYIFNGLKAVSQTDAGQDLSGFVDFTLNEKESDIKNGIYKITVKLLKASADILIQPDCTLLPEITSYSPSPGEINYSNTPITINFNMAMENLFCYGQESISIKYLTLDMSDFFEKPVFDSKTNILTLTPDSQKLREFIENQNLAYISLELSFGKNITAKINGGDYSLKNSPTFTVRYEPKIETTPPEKYEFFVTRHEISLENAENLPEEEKFNQVLLSAMTDEQILQNRTNGTFYIYGKYYDAESGVNSIKITEKRTNDTKSNIVYEEEKSVIYDSNSENARIEKKDGYGIFCIKYESLLEDGALLFSVTAVDKAGNSSDSQNFTAIKNNGINYEAIIRNLPKDFKINDVFDKETYKENLKNLKIYGSDINTVNYATFYGTVKLSEKNMRFACEYTDKDGGLRHEDFSDYDEETGMFNHTLDVENVANLCVKLILTIDIGKVLESEICFPSKPCISNLTNVNSTGNKYTKIEFAPSGKGSFNSLLCLYYNDEGILCSKSFGNTIKFYDSGDENYIIPYEYLYGEISEEIYSYNTTLSALTDTVSVEDISFSKGNEAGKIDFTVTLSDDSWSKFDSIFFKYTISSENSIVTSKNYFFEAGSLSQTFSEYQGYIYDSDLTFEFYGIKGTVQSSVSKYTKSGITGADYDSITPTLAYQRNGFEYLTLNLTDKGTGPESCTILLNGKTEFYMSEETGFSLEIPLYYFDKGENLFYYTATDKAGNSVTKNLKYQLDYSGTYSSLINDSGTYQLVSDEVFETDEIQNYGQNVFLYAFSDSGKWENGSDSYAKCSKASSTGENGGTIYKLNLNKFTIPEDSFVKIITLYSNAYSIPKVFYTGSPSSGKYDLLLANGSSKESVAIQSDSLVFVHTLVTDKSYEECKDWSPAEWLCYKKSVGESLLDFSTVRLAQKYTIPAEEICEGECYCVIAHFADGGEAISEIWQK